jgi:DNA-binding winged helix-turn-helix (wHTH) protein
MPKEVQPLYEFGPFRVDVGERLLSKQGEPVQLTAKVFDLLVVLVEHQGRLIEKEYLIKTLWPDSFVEEANLSVNISALRKALGELPNNPQYIETVPKRGYASSRRCGRRPNRLLKKVPPPRQARDVGLGWP